MKTYTTSEAIAILERDSMATFEAPDTGSFSREVLYGIDGQSIMFEVLIDDMFHPDGCISLRSDWVRTDKEES